MLLGGYFDRINEDIRLLLPQHISTKTIETLRSDQAIVNLLQKSDVSSRNDQRRLQKITPKETNAGEMEDFDKSELSGPENARAYQAN